MSKSIYQSAIIFGLNDRLFLNALEGITEEQAKERLSDHNNPINWIAAHTVWARFNTLIFLGSPVKNPFEGMFENFAPFDPNATYPSLAKIKEEWEKAGNLLKTAFEAVTEEHLAAESPIKSPIGDFTNGGTVAFLAQHESYDIGQIAFLKKYHTNSAMSYN